MRKLVIFLLLSALVLVYITPIIFMLAGSLKSDVSILTASGSMSSFFSGDVSLQNFRDVFERVNFGLFMFNSLFITIAIVIVGLIINSLAGYAFARLHWRGRETSFALVIALLIIPFEAIAVPLFYQVTFLGWRDTYWVQVVPFIANAFSIYLFYSFFIGLPKELEEAASVDGAGPLRRFVSMIIPNSKPVFATVAILTFLTQWGSFLWPLMVTSGERVRPLPLAIAQFHSLPPLQWGDIMAFGVMMVAPVIFVFLVFQGWFVRSVAATGIKG